MIASIQKVVLAFMVYVIVLGTASSLLAYVNKGELRILYGIDASIKHLTVVVLAFFAVYLENAKAKK